jgi:hypothetical protein
VQEGSVGRVSKLETQPKASTVQGSGSSGSQAVRVSRRASETLTRRVTRGRNGVRCEVFSMGDTSLPKILVADDSASDRELLWEMFRG